MLEPTGTRDHARALSGIARCSQCGTPLLKIGTNYCCPNLALQPFDHLRHSAHQRAGVAPSGGGTTH